MHDNVAEVDQNPATIGVPFDAGNFVAPIPYRFDDGVGDCARLNFRPAADDCKLIGQDRAAADIENGERLALFVERALAHDVDQLADALISVVRCAGMQAPKRLAAASAGGAGRFPLPA